MVACECLIVGGGPAGSACAWALHRAGVDSAILDKSTFPRDKICGGWITPQVLQELEIGPDYANGRVFQPIKGFRVGCIDGRATETSYDEPVSYGIRRCEFDEYLVRRSGTRLLEKQPFRSVERVDDAWIVNGEVKARVLVAAGGHFCPVARHLNPRVNSEIIVAAQEAEFEMSPAQRKACAVQGDVPELYFCRDLRGYGWCFRKGDFLNVGLGRLDPHQVSEHVAEFIAFLRRTKRIEFDLPRKPLGHAYLLYGKTQRNFVDDGVLLIGDAAGLAYSQSGEGIRPAIESGLLAAKALIEAKGDYSRANLEAYRKLLTNRFGNQQDWSTRIGPKLPPWLMSTLGRLLLATPWFSRQVVVEKWFLHADEPALAISPEAVAV
ncbi:MAG TPA: NAD(P)/FAD-dependent oxidoreductase [Candidatus Acidoferrum sp.]|nr:NAD(P)/FAD-dependent oxidoreductase [Candidatus Acidoferrum sp.]